MSLADVKKAAELMESSGREVLSSGGITPEIIADCEAWLSTKLPASYKTFLARWGSLGFGASDFYGFTRRGFEADRAPSFLWVTQRLRKREEIGSTDVAIKSSGFGPYFVLRCGQMTVDGECPVQLADGTDQGERFYNFGSFLLAEIEGELKS